MSRSWSTSSRTFFDQLEDADFNFTEIDQSALDNPEADAASERIDEFCGFDTDDAPSTPLTRRRPPTSATSVVRTRRSPASRWCSVFTAMGMTDEQANCVVDNIDFDEVGNAESVDPSMYFDLFDDCGFDLSNPGG